MPQLQILDISSDGESTTATLPVGAFRCTITISDGRMMQYWEPDKPRPGILPPRYSKVLRKAMRDAMKAHAGLVGGIHGVF